MASPRIYQVSFQFGGSIQSSMPRAFNQARQNINGVNAGLMNAQRHAGITGKAMNGLAGSLKTVAGIAGTYLGFRAVTGFFKDSINTFANFEQAMSKVKAITGSTGQELHNITQLAKDMGRKTSKSAIEAAEAISYMGLAGWDSQKIMSGLEPVLRLSEAGEIDLARASDLVTDSMSALGLNVQELPKYLDTLAQSSRKSNTNIDAMMEAYLKVGGTFKNLKVPMSEQATMLGILANRGQKGAEAGTALSSTITNLTAPVGQAKKALKALNLSAFDKKGNFKGLEKTLLELKGKLKGMTEEQQNYYISMIAGKENIKTVNNLMSGLSEEYSQLKSDIKNADGALSEMADTMQDNLKGAFTRLGSAVEGFKIDFAENMGKGLTPIVDGFANKIISAGPMVISAFHSIQAFIGTEVLPRFNNIRAIVRDIAQTYFPNLSISTSTLKDHASAMVTGGLDLVIGGLTWIRDNSGLVKALLVGITSAYVAQKGILIGLTVAQQAQNIAMAVSKGFHIANRALIVAKTTATLTGSSAIAAITAAQWLWNTAMAANPVGTVIVVVAALAVGIYALYKNFDKVTGAIKKAWDWLTKWNKTDAKSKDIKVPHSYEVKATKDTAIRNSIPQFAKGVNNFRGGPAIVGEEGPELVYLNKGSNVFPNKKTESILTQFSSNSTGSKMSNNQSAPVHIVYSPQYTIQGNADMNTLKKVSKQSEDDLKIKIRNIFNNQDRLVLNKG